MIDLKETAEQQVSEAISEALKAHSHDILNDLSSNLETLLGDFREASEHDGLNRSDIASTIQFLAEAVDFARDDIGNNSQASDKCPSCGSEEVDGDSVEVSETEATQEVACLQCESTWYNVFLLSNQLKVANS